MRSSGARVMIGQLSCHVAGQQGRGHLRIVVLPGFGVARYLRPASHDLADRFNVEVLLVDPPGFGANRGVLARPITVASVADRLRSWLTGLGPVLLVGQSTGCLLAARLARSDSGLDVRGVGLVGPVVDPTAASARRIGLRLVIDAPREPLWLGPVELPEWISNAPVLPGYLRSCLSERLEHHLRNVECPVVVVRGGRDPLSRHDWAAGLVDRPCRTLVTVPGGGHTHMAADPESIGMALAAAGFGSSGAPG